MDNYDKLLNEINMFLATEEIENKNTNVEVISLYELYNAINEEFKGLKKLSTVDKIFKKKLDTFRFYMLGNYDRFFKNVYYYVNIFGNENISRITFSNSDVVDSDDYCSISIEKDKKSNDIYISKKPNTDNKHIYKFIKKNYDLILETLLEIEKYVDLVGDLPGSNDIYEFKNSSNLFDYTVRYDKAGWVNIFSDISVNHPLYDEYNKTYIQKQSIHEYVSEKKNEILKRIPIAVHEIPEKFINIYNKYKEDKKEKELVKSIRWWN